jgi:hypothetical protein
MCVCVCVCVCTETGIKKKWELDGLGKVEATVWSSFGSQHNERALSDMLTSFHGKLKVVSLPSSYGTTLELCVHYAPLVAFPSQTKPTSFQNLSN